MRYIIRVFCTSAAALPLVLLPALSLADYEGGMMRGQGMMWGGHMGGGWFIFFGLYVLAGLAAVIIFFWLMFRIARALEAIASAQEKKG